MTGGGINGGINGGNDDGGMENLGTYVISVYMSPADLESGIFRKKMKAAFLDYVNKHFDEFVAYKACDCGDYIKVSAYICITRSNVLD